MKIIEVIVNAGHEDTLRSIAEQHEVVDFWCGSTSEEDRVVVSMIVRPEKRQVVLDALQSAIGSTEGARINVLPLEVTLPRPVEKEDEDDRRSVSGSREELYNEIEKGAKLDGNYLLLVFLSTIVATIGLVENNVAVIIGAMVIAPLLGPIIALAFSSTLGDGTLMARALWAAITGLGISFLLSVLLGIAWPLDIARGEMLIASGELLSRTDVGLDGAVLALASGAAAILSLSTGLSTTLVGVMVAVALLPPTATTGLLLGAGHLELALGAALLLAVNVVCVIVAAKTVFMIKGVRPRTWYERSKARQSTRLAGLFWGALLVMLLIIVIARHRMLA